MSSVDEEAKILAARGPVISVGVERGWEVNLGVSERAEKELMLAFSGGRQDSASSSAERYDLVHLVSGRGHDCSLRSGKSVLKGFRSCIRTRGSLSNLLSTPFKK